MSVKTKLLAVAVAASIAVPASAVGTLNFIIDGDTFGSPFSITNNSTDGETVLGFGLTLIAPFGFDTVNGGFGIDNAFPFTPQGGSDVSTGYTGPASFADGSTSIAFTFNDFDPGETFSWVIDVDQPSNFQVFGNELIGSTAYVDFSNGLRGLGSLVAVQGNPQGAQFVVSTFIDTPAIPEPATWAMLITGFGLVGFAARRRRQTAVTA